MGIMEKEVEKYLVKKVKEDLGGIAYKWMCPGRVGVPDRICMLPEGFAVPVEVKTLKGKLSVRQQREHAALLKLRHPVFVLNSKEQVDLFCRGMKEMINHAYNQRLAPVPEEVDSKGDQD